MDLYQETRFPFTLHVSKAYTDRVLLDDVGFGINKNEKIGVIGVNGMGKSTLLKIVAGIEESDAGTISMGNQVKICYLPQMPVFEAGTTILRAATEGNYDELNRWTIEAEAKSMLNQLGFTDYAEKIEHMSGGQKKRVALVNALLTPADIFEQKEENAKLYEALASLPEKQRNRITSHFLLGMSLSDIAKSEGTGVSSVHEGIQRGLRRLKKILEKINTDPENYHQK